MKQRAKVKLIGLGVQLAVLLFGLGITFLMYFGLVKLIKWAWFA